MLVIIHAALDVVSDSIYIHVKPHKEKMRARLCDNYPSAIPDSTRND